MSARDGDGPPDAADGSTRRRRLMSLLDKRTGHSLDGDRPQYSPTPPAATNGHQTPEREAPAPGLPGLLPRLDRVCAVAVSQLGVDGAGVTVMGSLDGGRGGSRDQLAATGPLTGRLEELQFTAGEGPCLDAYEGGMPVLAGDLAAETTRWLGFGPEAIAAGAAAVFSLPLQVGAVGLGTLDLYRAGAGPLSREQLADALMLATLATEVLLELAEHPGPLGNAADPESAPAAGWLPDVHADVHVASGMLAAQQGIGVGAALLRLRGHAFATGEPISDLARRIIDRTLVLENPGTDTEPGSKPRHPEEKDGPSAPDPETDH